MTYMKNKTGIIYWQKYHQLLLSQCCQWRDVGKLWIAQAWSFFWYFQDIGGLKRLAIIYLGNKQIQKGTNFVNLLKGPNNDLITDKNELTYKTMRQESCYEYFNRIYYNIWEPVSITKYSY